MRQTGYETGTGHTVWVLIKPTQCVKQGMKLALATQSDLIKTGTVSETEPGTGTGHTVKQ